MCGRFTLRTPANVLIEHFDLDVRLQQQRELFEARSNIAPTDEILTVRSPPPIGERIATMMRWGLVPSWSKDIKGSGRPLINARCETLAEKPAFRTALRSRRCLIPADGFYEWKKPAGGRGKKQPFHIHRPDGGPMAFAGLWEQWTDPDQPFSIESCTIVTTDANAVVQELHDRMPVIVAPNDYALWLDPAIEDPAKIAHLLAPCDDNEVVAEPVTTDLSVKSGAAAPPTRDRGMIQTSFLTTPD